MNEFWDVMVIDDEPIVCASIRLVLEARGLRVATCEDGRSALAHPAADRCRLVLCDLMLPESSGLDVLRALHARRPTLPVVMITGYATAERALQAVQAGAAGFLPKPFDETELLTLVRRSLEPEVVAREEDSP